MLDFDVKTLFFLFLLGNAFNVFFFLVYIKLYNAKRKLNFYVVSKALQTCSWLLFVLRANLPESVYVGVANVFLLSGIAMEMFLFISVGIQNTRKLMKQMILLTIACCVFFLFNLHQPEYVRVVIMSSFFSVIMGFACFILFKLEKSTYMQQVFGFFTVLTATLFAVRAIFAYWGKGDEGLYSQSVVQVIVYIVFFLISYTWPIIFLFLLKEQNEMIIEENKKQIEIDNKVLKELNATKDRFFSIVAHDLRGPFNAIIGYSELMKMKSRVGDYEEFDYFSGMLHDSAQRTHTLLENLLQWSRIQTGRIEFVPDFVNLDNLVESIGDLLYENLKEKNVRFAKSIIVDTDIVADRFMLETIIRNLLSNAIKFTPEGGAVLVYAEMFENVVKVVVEDSGVGIKQNRIADLFKIETNNSTKGTKNETGTGLGLILCHDFVSQHNGKIWVESVEGKGSRFIFTIPQNK